VNKLDLECLKYASQDTLINIEKNYKKIVGVECNPEILNENEKTVGRVILFSNSNNKVSLNLIVQFRADKIKWISNKELENKKLVLVDPYWVKSYTPNPKLNVPTNIFDIKTNQKITIMRELTYNQFMKNRLLEYYGKWMHRYVEAYENFCNLMKSKSYYYAINSTVKNYFIPQEDLKEIIALINNQKKKIKKEWNGHLNKYLEQHQSQKSINELFAKNNEKSPSKVLDFKRKSN
jgi:hypothetical protein